MFQRPGKVRWFGPGLTISKTLVRLMQGEIGVSSVLGQGRHSGSSFHLNGDGIATAVAGLPQLLRGAFWSSTIRELTANSRRSFEASQDDEFLAGSGAEAMTLLRGQSAAGKAFDIASLTSILAI